MSEKSYRDAIRDAMMEEMDRDANVLIMGEDIGVYEGTFRITAGMLKKYGPKRVIDTPIAEAGMAGTAVGMAMLGRRPIVEMMTMNFAIVAADQILNHAAKVRFDNEDYLRYVPIRRPWTMCVQEQLPPGAAGALLNQTHLFDDLFLFINTREKEFYDSIDGRRSISEIVEKVNAKDSQHAREFFEKLGRYDQVVFDTSQCF